MIYSDQSQQTAFQNPQQQNAQLQQLVQSLLQQVQYQQAAGQGQNWTGQGQGYWTRSVRDRAPSGNMVSLMAWPRAGAA